MYPDTWIMHTLLQAPFPFAGCAFSGFKIIHQRLLLECTAPAGNSQLAHRASTALFQQENATWARTCRIFQPQGTRGRMAKIHAEKIFNITLIIGFFVVVYQLPTGYLQCIARCGDFNEAVAGNQQSKVSQAGAYRPRGPATVIGNASIICG